MKKFIYKIESLPLSPKNEETLKWLNELGAIGWEMTGLVTTETNNHYYFKKDVTSAEEVNARLAE